MNDNNSSSSGRKGSKEFANRLAEVNGGFESWLKLRRKFTWSIGVGIWTLKSWDWEFMNVDVVIGKEVPSLVTASGLVDVSRGANVVDWDVISGDETGEMQELTQVALC